MAVQCGGCHFRWGGRARPFWSSCFWAEVTSRPGGILGEEYSKERRGQEFWGGKGGPSSRKFRQWGRTGGGDITEVSVARLCGESLTRMRKFFLFWVMSEDTEPFFFFSKEERWSHMFPIKILKIYSVFDLKTSLSNICFTKLSEKNCLRMYVSTWLFTNSCSPFRALTGYQTLFQALYVYEFILPA